MPESKNRSKSTRAQKLARPGFAGGDAAIATRLQSDGSLGEWSLSIIDASLDYRKSTMKIAEIARLADLRNLIGQEIAISDWVTITQERINQFADATGDHQWIHVDVERARNSPFKSTIAHGFLTLSLIPLFSQECVKMTSVKMGVNYGLNKVRFPNPVPAGSRLRGRFTVKDVEDIAGGIQLTLLSTVEIEGADKPACVAESVSRRFE
jgi:acyl dehydratase